MFMYHPDGHDAYGLWGLVTMAPVLIIVVWLVMRKE